MSRRNLVVGLLTVLMAAVSAVRVMPQMTLSGQVVDVIDGKTLMLALPGGNVRVELQFIETPQPEQKLYQETKTHLSQMLKGKTVEYRPTRLAGDSAIGLVRLNGVDVSQQMLRDGGAWLVPVTTSYQDRAEYDTYAAIESAAKADKIGVWAVKGLLPPWDERSKDAAAQTAAAAKRSSTITGVWGDKNPKLGDVGALLHGYNAASRQGYISTGLLAITREETESVKRMAGEVTYRYRETAKGRVGNFVIVIVAESTKPQFAASKNITLIGDTRTLSLGSPTRTVQKTGLYTRETLTLQVSRSTIVNMYKEGEALRIGYQTIYPTGLRYMLANMLSVAN